MSEDPIAGLLVQKMEALARTIGPWTDCPHCGAKPDRQERRNYSMIWGTAEIWCIDCGGFVRDWDRD